MVGRREAGSAAAALLVLAAGLRAACLGFVAGQPGTAAERHGLPSSLRGCAASDLLRNQSEASADVEAFFPAAGSFVLGAAVIAAASVRRREASPVSCKATRTEWYRKVRRIGGDRAVFDVSLPKPMGVKMEALPDMKNEGQFKGVGISEIVKDGGTDELNKTVCITEESPGMWVLEGDRVVAVDGQDALDLTLDEVVQLVMANEKETIDLTLMRNTRRGPIKVVIMPEGLSATVRRNSRLSAAAEYAFGKELKYGCVDGWCGTCWHRERTTNGVFKPCCDVLTGDWDNVMPLVIFPKPERQGDTTLMSPRGT